jgi:hypothetical protein
MPIVLTLRRLTQKDCKFKTSLGYLMNPFLKQTKKKDEELVSVL